MKITVLSDLQAAVESIATFSGALDRDHLGLNDIVLYHGITRKTDVWDECLRWLTTRGIMKSDGSYSGQKNRPTLVWADGRCITMMVQ